MKRFLTFLCILSVFSCEKKQESVSQNLTSQQYITVLGTAQDGGFPHIGCQRECCANFYNGTAKKQKVVALGLIDKDAQKKFLFEATPASKIEDLT